jgi:hypothetical protein
LLLGTPEWSGGDPLTPGGPDVLLALLVLWSIQEHKWFLLMLAWEEVLPKISE